MSVIPRHAAASRARVLLLPPTPISRSHSGDPPDRDGGGGGRQDPVPNAAQPHGGGGRRRPPAAGPPRRGVTAPRRRPGLSVPASPGPLHTFSPESHLARHRSPHVSAPVSVSGSRCRLSRASRARRAGSTPLAFSAVHCSPLCFSPGVPANRSWSWGAVLLLFLLTMAHWNLSRDVSGDRDHSGGTSRPPLPRPDNGDTVCPVPLWEREFFRNAYDIPWATFCLNKRFIRLYKSVMDWDDSGALKNFLDAKERFRAKYFGEPFEDPVLDPDMYIQGNQPPAVVGRAHPYCTPNKSNSNFYGLGQSNNRHQQGVDPGQTSSGTARMLPGSSRIWIGGASTGGAIKLNGGSGGGGSGNGGGRGGSGCGSGFNWNCFGRRNQRNQDVGRHQMRSGGGQQQVQRGRKMEWRPVLHYRAPKDDPAA